QALHVPEAVVQEDRVEEQGRGRRLELDQGDREEDLVVVPSRGRGDLRLAVVPGIPRDRYARRDVRVVDLDVARPSRVVPEPRLERARADPGIEPELLREVRDELVDPL